MDAHRLPTPAVLSTPALYRAGPGAPGAAWCERRRGDLVGGGDGAGICRAGRLSLGVPVLLSPVRLICRRENCRSSDGD
jgi:hypothetical protein